ncbi:MAG: hypothetical protein Q9227_004656 [Pyrenula ochraceoflavens]
MNDLLPIPEHYQYTSLPNVAPPPHYIRLLRLGVHDFELEDEVNCALQTFTFNVSNKSCPPYTALSYTWGPAESLENVSNNESLSLVKVNGRPLQASANLCAGLEEITRRLRRSNEAELYLWVDAICIDQKNFVEKGQQVDMMGEIYRHADSVIVWLGTGLDNEIQEVRSMVKGAASLVQSIHDKIGEVNEKTNHLGSWQRMSEIERQSEFDRHQLPRRGAVQWLYFWNFFKRRWFSRIWGECCNTRITKTSSKLFTADTVTQYVAIQELVLAREVEYYCGQFTFPRDEVLLCTDLLYWEIVTWPELVTQTYDYDLITSSRNVFVIDDLYHESGRFKYHDRVALVGPWSNRESPWKFLMNLLYSSRRHQATTSKDKVYALLGLVRTKKGLSSVALDKFVKADYTKPSSQVFVEAAQGIILDTKWLGPLVLVENRPDLDDLNLPSHVPDFSCRGDQFGLGWQVFEDILPPLIDMSSQAPHAGKPTFEGSLLQCQGIYLQTLASVSEPFTDLFDGKTDFKNGAAIIETRRKITPPGRTLDEIPWQTFLAGDKRLDTTHDLARSFTAFCISRLLQYQMQFPVGTAMPSNIQDFDLVRTLLSYENSIDASDAARLSQFHLPPNHQDDALVEQLKRDGRAFETIFSCHYLDRALFRTNQGFLGTCHSAMRPGDQVWFLARAPCPFVLRKVQNTEARNHFKLVGWAHLEGFPSRDAIYTDWVQVNIV